MLKISPFILGLFILCGGTAHAQQSIAFANLTPLGYCQLAISSAVKINTCSGGIPAKAAAIIVIDETANTRWRDDGTAPTTSTGMLFASGTVLTYMGDLTNIQFVAVSGSPVLDISFYGTRQP